MFCRLTGVLALVAGVVMSATAGAQSGPRGTEKGAQKGNDKAAAERGGERGNDKAAAEKGGDKAPAEGMPNMLTAPSSDPVDDRVSALREAADLVTRAKQARQRGQVWFAEQLFSAAELLVGPESLATLGPLFRAATPERIQTALRQFAASSAPQPALVGRSDEDEPPSPAPRRGTLSGVVRLEGAQPIDGVGVVTLDLVGGKEHAARPRHAVMEQRDRQFRPHILVVPVGSTVAFPNFDPIYHNVFSRSPTRPFDLGLFKEGQAREVVVDRTGVIKLGCNLHLNMTGYVVVVNSAHYAVTDANGRFTFKNLVPGTYTMRTWSEQRADLQTQTIVIKPDHMNVVIHLAGPKLPNTIIDKFGAVRSVM